MVLLAVFNRMLRIWCVLHVTDTILIRVIGNE